MRVIKNTTNYLELIKFSHSIFALPFALISTFLALRSLNKYNVSSDTLKTVGWIVLAMVSARSGAMGFNRFIDRKWDSKNPRTASRPSVTGEITPLSIAVLVVLSFSIFVFGAWNLSPLAFKLSPLAIFLVCFYSYTKRFTSFSHFFLGVAIGSAPVASWIAITNSVSLSSVVIGISVLTWIAGFDVLYALQDLEFDASENLFSIPKKIGVEKSLIVSRSLHLMTVVCWIILAYLESLQWVFFLGIVACVMLLIREHRLLDKDDLSKLDVAFFNMNAIIGVAIFVAFYIDTLLY